MVLGAVAVFQRGSNRLSRRVLNVTVALVLHDRAGGVWLGSAICIRVGERFFLATAAHNLQQISHLRTIPRGRYRSDPIRSIGSGIGRVGDDVAWIELCPKDIERRKVAHLDLEHLDLEHLELGTVDPGQPVERPALGEVCERGAGSLDSGRSGMPSRALTHGFPAAGMDADWLYSTRFQVPGAWIPGRVSEPERIGEVVQSWRHRDLPPSFKPNGISGGGMWRRGEDGDYRLAGLARTWDASSRVLLGTAIDRWLDALVHGLPELRPVVEAG